METRYPSIRRPEYTGERRCWPCTVTNVAILGLACGLVLLISRSGALLLALAGGVMIWLRGYLVPYTPRLAPRLLEWLPVGANEPPPVGDAERTASSLASATGAGPTTERGAALTTALVDAGVLETDSYRDRLFLAESFRTRWMRECRTVRTFEADELENAVVSATDGGVDVEVLDAAEGVEPWIGVTSPGTESWVPHAIAIAEMGAVRAMAALAPEISPDDRFTAAGPLRAFLDVCPRCDGRVVETTPTACCGSVRDRQSLPESIRACTECDARVYSVA